MHRAMKRPGPNKLGMNARRTKLGMVSVGIAAVFTLASVAPANAADDVSDLTAGEVEAALTGAAASQVEDAVAAAATTADAAVTNGDAAVTVPRDPAGGVELTVGSTSISIVLPEASSAEEAVTLDSGVVTYPSDSGVANAVVPLESGVQLLTTIASSNSPTSYGYDIAVPDGGTVALAEDGSALVIAGDGEVLLTSPAPWAVDANGAAVATHYEVSGSQLIQVVDHHADDYAYPIVADPRFDQGIGWKSLLFNKRETRTLAGSGFLGLGGIATACGIGGPVAVAACGLAAGAIGGAAQYGVENGICVGISFWGVLPYAGWNPFWHSGRDCY